MAGESSILELIAILGASALAIFIVAVAIMSGMQAVADNSPTLLSKMIAAQGLDPLRAMASTEGREFGLAVRRCTRCGGRESCRAWLASGQHDGFQAFCPNAAFIQSLKRP